MEEGFLQDKTIKTYEMALSLPVPVRSTTVGVGLLNQSAEKAGIMIYLPEGAVKIQVPTFTSDCWKE